MFTGARRRCETLVFITVQWVDWWTGLGFGFGLVTLFAAPGALAGWSMYIVRKDRAMNSLLETVGRSASTFDGFRPSNKPGLSRSQSLKLRAIIGPNGAGKRTTFMDIVTGKTAPTRAM